MIDADGVVRYAHRATAGLTFRPVAEIIDALHTLALTDRFGLREWRVPGAVRVGWVRLRWRRRGGGPG